jgi:hypothetical protein
MTTNQVEGRTGGGGTLSFDGGVQDTGGRFVLCRGVAGGLQKQRFVAGFLNRPPAGECFTCVISSAATSAAPESRPTHSGTTFKARLEAGALQDAEDYLGTILTLSLPT